MSAVPLQIDRLAVVGVGLIGGSVALAARQRGLAREVIGVGRNPQRLRAAVEAGVVNSFCRVEELPRVQLAVICTPVDRVAEDAAAVLKQTEADTLVTDAGSVKGAILDSLLRESRQRFIGAHPLAGSHLTGFEHASANLFNDRVCVLTPTPESPPAAVKRIREFWEQLGMRVREMTPAHHDAALARTSHFPHLAAALVAAAVPAAELPLAAGGFRDTTRVAQGDPELWSAIFELNAGPLRDEISRATAHLDNLARALESGDRAAITAFLEQARNVRSQYSDSSPHVAPHE